MEEGLRVINLLTLILLSTLQRIDLRAKLLSLF